MEGRLRLAEKERQRLKGNAPGGVAAGPAGAAAGAAGPSKEELAELEAVADANMAALLEEEAVKKAGLSITSQSASHLEG